MVARRSIAKNAAQRHRLLSNSWKELLGIGTARASQCRMNTESLISQRNLRTPILIASAIAIVGATWIGRRARRSRRRAFGESAAAIALKRAGMALLVMSAQQLARRAADRFLARPNPLLEPGKSPTDLHPA